MAICKVQSIFSISPKISYQIWLTMCFLFQFNCNSFDGMNHTHNNSKRKPFCCQSWEFSVSTPYVFFVVSHILLLLVWTIACTCNDLFSLMFIQRTIDFGIEQWFFGRDRVAYTELKRIQSIYCSSKIRTDSDYVLLSESPPPFFRIICIENIRNSDISAQLKKSITMCIADCLNSALLMIHFVWMDDCLPFIRLDISESVSSPPPL